MEFKGFKDLECYKKARELRLFVSLLVKNFPSHEKFLLTSQITRSARSVSANICEGYGRFTYTDTKNFFIISRGSTLETMDHLQTALDENYINEKEFIEGGNLCESVFRLLNGYISYLNRQHNSPKEK